jgi:hypothetical protein
LPLILFACNEARDFLLQFVTASDADIPSHCRAQSQTNIFVTGYFLRSCGIANSSCSVLSPLWRYREINHIICSGLPAFEHFFPRGIFLQGIPAGFNREKLQSSLFIKPVFFACPSSEGNIYGRMDFAPQLLPIVDYGVALYEDEQHTSRRYIPLFGKSDVPIGIRIQGFEGSSDRNLHSPKEEYSKSADGVRKIIFRYSDVP